MPDMVVLTLPFQGSVHFDGISPLARPNNPPTVAPLQSVSHPAETASPTASSKES